jgi:hypothetical protein
MLEEVMLLSTQLLNQAILGLYFLNSYEAEINFPERMITLRVGEEIFNLEFMGVEKLSNRICD